jgi:hypothetical protein
MVAVRKVSGAVVGVAEQFIDIGPENILPFRRR